MKELEASLMEVEAALMQQVQSCSQTYSHIGERNETTGALSCVVPVTRCLTSVCSSLSNSTVICSLWDAAGVCGLLNTC